MKPNHLARIPRVLAHADSLCPALAARSPRPQRSTGVHRAADGRSVWLSWQQPVAEVHGRGRTASDEPADAIPGWRSATPELSCEGNLRLVPGNWRHGRALRRWTLGLTVVALIGGCAAPDPESWKAERSRYAARVALHQCIDDKKAGKVSDCRGPIHDYQVHDASYEHQRLWETRDMGNTNR